MLDTYTGTWSLYTVVIAVVMVLISLVLMVVLLVMGMMGRFRQNPPAEDAEDEDNEPLEADEGPALEAEEPARNLAAYDDPEDLYDGFEPESEAKNSAKTLVEGFFAPASASAKPRKRRRQTGLWQLLAALLACAPALMSAAWLDNIYGRLVAFTVGAGINLGLLAAQIFLIVWLVRLQRRL